MNNLQRAKEEARKKDVNRVLNTETGEVEYKTYASIKHSDLDEIVTFTYLQAVKDCAEIVEADKRLYSCYEGCKCISRIKKALSALITK